MPRLISRFVGGLRGLFARQRTEQELDEELRAYVDAAIEQKLACGLTAEEAARAARAEVGSLAAVKDHTRDAGWESALEHAVADVRYAMRTLRRAPGFAAVAILTLALGIGAATAIFSVVDAVVLRGLPFDEYDRLVAVGTSGPSPFAVPMVTLPSSRGRGLSAIAAQDFLDWRERQTAFTDLAAFSLANVAVRYPDGDAEELRAARVTGEFFDVLRVRPPIGRTFAREHERSGSHRIAVLGHALWQRRFGGDPNVVGRTIQLDFNSYEIAGVAPPELAFPIGSDKPTELWVPLVIPPDEQIRHPGRYSASLRAIGRLRDGVSLAGAEAQMNAVAAALERQYPEWNRNRRAGLLPLHESIVGVRTRSWMLLLLASVAIVLLIVCANVASLMLARASGREREIAIRAATGASRSRIVRQLLIEASVLWIAAAAVGVLVATWGVQVLEAAMPESVPRIAAMAIDLRVLLVATASTIATALLFGLFPALHASRPNLAGMLSDRSRGAAAAPERQRLRSALVVAELALAVVLLVGAGLFIRSFGRVMAIDLGFDPERVLTAGVVLFRGEPAATMRGWEALAELETRVRAIPGVVDVAGISGTIPLASSTSMTRVAIPGQPFNHEDTQLFVSSITPAYHRVMRIPLRSGRFLAPTDHDGQPLVAVINEAAAKRFFPDSNPIGQVLQLQSPRQVVGVVGNVRQGGFETDVAPTAYVPLAQSARPASARSAQLLIRTMVDPVTVLAGLRAAVADVLPGEPVRDARTLDDALARLTAQRRLSVLLLSGFGIVALVVAAVGVYGVMAHLVRQRMYEIGVRMALGASRAEVVGAVLGRAAALTAAGLVVGTAGAWFASASVRAFLFQVEPTDTAAFATALLVLAGSALLASVVPTYRAATIDPLTALRQE